MVTGKEIKMKLTIEQVVNGFVVTYPQYLLDSEEPEIRSIVIEENLGEFKKQDAFVRLCWELQELFQIPDSDNDRRRVVIKLTGK
jgi:hypothetical protein